MGLPDYAQLPSRGERATSSSSAPRWVQLLPLLILVPFISNPLDKLFPKPTPAFIQSGLDQCAALNAPLPSASSARSKSDRYVPGTKAVLLTNGTIWTGNDKGEEIIYEGSLLLENGLIKKVGTKDDVLRSLSKAARAEIKEVNLGGNWVTPGIVDNHSHLGVGSSPGLNGAADSNSHKAPILPFLRSIDGLNTHDQAYNLTIAGGVTTALVLPGSANNIGGQAFVIKPRQTAENTPSSMVVESPFAIGEGGGIVRTGAIRHMKHACGENIANRYSSNRMDQAYGFRKAYTSGTALKVKQDAWCSKGAANTEPFPDDLEWEALADVIRGNVKVQVHCYETVDLDQLIRLTNEFKFSIAAVHHAHEAWLVTDLLKKAYGNTPAAASVPFNSRVAYKREAFRGSEFAPKILSEAGIDVVMKSDHPVLDSRYLIFEAAQAHYYGLNASLALSSVTTTPAKIIGKDQRLGYLRDNYDADVVVWDAHPLSLGATPKQVYIDGVAQLESPFFNPPKEAKLQQLPVVPDFGDEAEIHKRARGDPDYAALLEKKIVNDVIFTNVKEVLVRNGNSLVSLVVEEESSESTIVVVEDGKIVCSGACLSTSRAGFEVVDLKGGSIIPGLLSFGAPLGLVEISSEASTQDGFVFDGLGAGTAPVLQDQIIRAADGAEFGTKNALIAARFGVTRGVTAPQSRGGLIAGLSFVFSTSAATPVSTGAILQEVAALHVNVGHWSPYSISTQIGILRKLLLGKTPDEEGWWKKVQEGEIPLVVDTDKADVIARLLVVKSEVEFETGKSLKLVISGGTEAHLIADDIAKANVGVIINRARSYPSVWDQRRLLAGPPLTAQTPIDALVSAGVLVGLGTRDGPEARNTRIEAGWTALGSSSLTTKSALALVSTNLEKLLGVKSSSSDAQDWVAVEGSIFSFEGKVVAKGGAGAKGDAVALL